MHDSVFRLLRRYISSCCVTLILIVRFVGSTTMESCCEASYRLGGFSFGSGQWMIDKSGIMKQVWLAIIHSEAISLPLGVGGPILLLLL